MHAEPNPNRALAVYWTSLVFALAMVATNACDRDSASPPAAVIEVHPAPGTVAQEPDGSAATAQVPTPEEEAAEAIAEDPALAAAADAGTLRIVSLGGGVTETLVALGLESQIVGVDSSSRWPESMQTLPQVGYHRRLSAEGVLGLAPTHVVLTSEAGPASVITQLRTAGVEILDAGATHTIEGATERLTRLGVLFGRRDEASTALATIEVQLGRLSPPTEPAPRVLFVYARGAAMLMVAGTDTGPDALLQRVGARNALGDRTGFAPLTAEAVVAADPDIILMPNDGLESVGGLEGLAAVPGVAQTRAWSRGAVASIDDSLLLAFGPRVGEAVLALQSALQTAGARL